MQLSSVVEFCLVGYAGRVPGKTDTTRPDPSYDPTRPWLLPDPGTRHQPGIPRPDTKQIQAVNNFKYLGIRINAQLNWKEQAQRSTANATSWIMQYRRLTRPQTGVGGRLMRRLYLAVALPKIMYGIDTWYTPPHKTPGTTKNAGSVSALRSLQKIQRVATIAITDALRTTPTDLIDAHAGLLSME